MANKTGLTKIDIVDDQYGRRVPEGTLVEYHLLVTNKNIPVQDFNSIPHIRVIVDEDLEFNLPSNQLDKWIEERLTP